MTEEVWRDIPEYEGKYLISNQGNVRSPLRSQLKTGKNGSGYLQVNLCIKNHPKKSKYVHRLVAQAFVENPNNLPQVNHKDFNKYNNCADNLEWISKIDNMRHAARTGRMGRRYTKAKKRKIKSFLGKLRVDDAALKFNVSPPTIKRIWANKEIQP